MPITITSSGDFKKTEKFLSRASDGDFFRSLDHYGRIGQTALAEATPQRSGETAASWGYRVIRNRRAPGIEWYNTNTVNGVNIAIIIQYGHATGTGGYVEGEDYINPAIRPIFDKIVSDIWKEVTA